MTYCRYVRDTGPVSFVRRSDGKVLPPVRAILLSEAFIVARTWRDRQYEQSPASRLSKLSNQHRNIAAGSVSRMSVSQPSISGSSQAGQPHPLTSSGQVSGPACPCLRVQVPPSSYIFAKSKTQSSFLARFHSLSPLGTRFCAIPDEELICFSQCTASTRSCRSTQAFRPPGSTGGWCRRSS